MNNVSHKAPKVKAIHKETSTPQPPTQENGMRWIHASR